MLLPNACNRFIIFVPMLLRSISLWHLRALIILVPVCGSQSWQSLVNPLNAARLYQTLSSCASCQYGRAQNIQQAFFQHPQTVVSASVWFSSYPFFSGEAPFCGLASKPNALPPLRDILAASSWRRCSKSSSGSYCTIHQVIPSSSPSLLSS